MIYSPFEISLGIFLFPLRKIWVLGIRYKILR